MYYRGFLVRRSHKEGAVKNYYSEKNAPVVTSTVAHRKETPIQWSVVIPAYNEEQRLPAYLHELLAYFDGRKESYEILVVDDGSQDDTGAAVAHLQRYSPALQLIQLPGNRGKGYAVRTGMQLARGALCLFTDADGATSIRELEKLEPHIGKGADIVIGSRALRSPECTLDARWHRKFFGRIFHRFVRLVGVRKIVDTQCGFKLFKAQVAKDLFSVLRIEGYGFDVEFLLIAQQRRYTITEVAVNWRDQPGSKVRVTTDGLRMLRELVIIRRNQLRGLYAYDTTGEILPVPPLTKEGTHMPPFRKGAAQSAGGFDSITTTKRTFASKIFYRSTPPYLSAKIFRLRKRLFPNLFPPE
jgi:dolichyl-phosphate beta-glucosyltransferase